MFEMNGQSIAFVYAHAKIFSTVHSRIPDKERRGCWAACLSVNVFSGIVEIFLVCHC